MSDSATAGIPGLTWLVGLAVVMSAISFYYYLVVLKQAFVKEGVKGEEYEGGTQSVLSLGHTFAIVIPAAGLVILGLFPGLLLEPITEAVLNTLK